MLVRVRVLFLCVITIETEQQSIRLMNHYKTDSYAVEARQLRQYEEACILVEYPR